VRPLVYNFEILGGFRRGNNNGVKIKNVPVITYHGIFTNDCKYYEAK